MGGPHPLFIMGAAKAGIEAVTRTLARDEI